MTTLSPELIAQLRCPETRQPLAVADDATLTRVRMASVDADLEGSLVREDGLRAYPVRDGFPILLLSEAISLEQDSPEG
ncbi:MAG: hypothetical protein KDN20_09235 [Verrucomicrobiae bacterium]|nr:hypothetical protein [Verrucomicrobiae bacterium]